MDAGSGIPKSQRALMRQMFELGWLYKKVQEHAGVDPVGQGKTRLNARCGAELRPSLPLFPAPAPSRRRRTTQQKTSGCSPFDTKTNVGKD